MEVFKLENSSYEGYSTPGFYFWDLKFEYVVGPFKSKKKATKQFNLMLEKAYGSSKCESCKKLGELMNEAYEKDINTYQYLKINCNDLFTSKTVEDMNELHCAACGKLLGIFHS